MFTADHDIQNKEESNLAKYRAMESFAREHGIDFYPPGTGIGHQIMVEQGYVLPETFVVASDSHSNMYGALGAIGTPVVRTDAAAIWATGEFWWQIPRTVQVVLEGKLSPGATGKDVIITLCGLYNREEVLNAAVEFAGPGVASLTMDERLTIANMTTEWGALVGWFPVDEVTLAYLQARNRELRTQGITRIPEEACRMADESSRARLRCSLCGAIVLDLAEVTPHVSGPDTVQVMQSVAEIAKKKVAIQKAYLVSCVNSRLEDLEAAAQVLQSKKSLRECSFIWRRPAAGAGRSREARHMADASRCGRARAAIGMWAVHRTGHGFAGSRRGRHIRDQSQFQRTHGIARCAVLSWQPGVVAASALEGYICGPPSSPISPSTRLSNFGAAATPAEKVEILPGFPARLQGRLVFLPQDNLNTDGIYGKDYTYREDMTPEMMARVVMENYDPQFSERTRPGTLL